MSKIQLLGAVAALALSFATAPAFAQVMPNASAVSPQSTSPAQSSRPVAFVAPSAIGSDRVRAVRQGDNDYGMITYEQFIAQHASRNPDGSVNMTETNQRFDSILNENTSACRNTGAWVRESIAIADEAKKIGVDLKNLSNELAELGAAQNRTTWVRRGFNVVGTIFLCALSPGKYCGAAVSAGFGNEAMGMSHDKASRTNRRQSEINVTQSKLQLRATLLTMDMNIGWAKMMQGYCLIVFPDETTGAVNYTQGTTNFSPSYTAPSTVRPQTQSGQMQNAGIQSRQQVEPLWED